MSLKSATIVHTLLLVAVASPSCSRKCAANLSQLMLHLSEDGGAS